MPLPNELVGDANAKFEVAGGAALMSAPIWQVVLQDINLIASVIAGVCGAIIGLHAVWRIWRRGRAERLEAQLRALQE